MKVDLKEYYPPEDQQRPAPPSVAARVLRLRQKFPGASTGLLSIFDQAIVSGTGFATAAIIGRMTAPEQLGLYYLTLTIVLIVVGVQDQIVAAPYLVYAKRHHGEEHAQYAGSSWFHHLLLTVASMVVLLLTIGILSVSGSTAILPGLWALVGAGPLLLVREDIRRFAFADLHLRSAIAIDAVVAVLQLGGLFLLGYYGHLTLFNIFAVMGGACALAALGWLIVDPPRVRFSRVRIRADWSHNWAFAKWALRGHLLGSTTPYVMIWIVNGAIGPVAAGVLGACTTLVGVTKVIQAGVTNVLTTQSSHAYVTGGWKELRRVMIRASLFLGLSVGSLCLLFLVTGDALAVLVYGEFYQGCGPILVTLSLAALVSSLSIVIGNGLWAIDQPRASFAADVCSTVITLAAAALLVPSMGALGAALATLAGSAVATLVRLVILVRAYEPTRFDKASLPTP
ncbi:MAG: lipopolysaccharide biosynthesis protein [Pirellulales bacterium]